MKTLKVMMALSLLVGFSQAHAVAKTVIDRGNDATVNCPYKTDVSLNANTNPPAKFPKLPSATGEEQKAGK